MSSGERDIRSDFTDVDRAGDPGHLVRFLNAVSSADGERWLANLQEASAAGRFFGSLTAFIVSGRKR